MQHTANRQMVSPTQLRVGDIAYFHGGTFEIVSTGESRGHIDGYGDAYGSFDAFVGPSPVAVPMGKLIGGKFSDGSFPMGYLWSFQGNHRAYVGIEARA